MRAALYVRKWGGREYTIYGGSTEQSAMKTELRLYHAEMGAANICFDNYGASSAKWNKLGSGPACHNGDVDGYCQ